MFGQTTPRKAPRRALAALTRRAPAVAHRRRSVSSIAIAIGVVLVVGGLLLFAHLQTQSLFQESQDQIRAGSVPRNDSGIVFGALLAATGMVVVICAISPRPFSERIGPASLFVGGTTLLLFAHYSIFVNGIVVSNGSAAMVRASFFFHDTAAALPIATFVLAMLTAALVVAIILATMALLTPDLFQRQAPGAGGLDERRVRTVLLMLAVLAFGMGFLRQFLTYALTADADPNGPIFGSGFILVYYLLSLTTLGALGLMSWRTYRLAWGDMREKRSRTFRRGYSYLTHSENWLWGTTVALNAIILIAEPVYQPDSNVDRVFAMNSKGVSMFFLLVCGIYLLQRYASRSFLEFARANPERLESIRWDGLAYVTLTLVVGWTLLALVFTFVDVTKLTDLITRFAFAGIVLGLFAVRLDADSVLKPQLRSDGGPIILLAATTAAVLTGIMLWGAGNTVITIYSRNGGFLFPEENVLQPYATGIRILGSLFIATPITIALWCLGARHHRAIHPGPLVVAGLSVVAAMNLLFTINAQDVTDASVRNTDVLIGFAAISLATLFDKVVVLTVFSATAAIGVLATARLMHHGTHRPKPTEPDGPLYA